MRRASCRASSQLAVVRVQRAAARLHRRRVDLAAVGQQHVRGVAIDVGKHQILHAAGQQRDAVARRAARLLARRDQRIRERAAPSRGACGSSRRRSAGSSRVRPSRRTSASRPAALIDTQHRPAVAQRARAHEQEPERQRAPEVAAPAPRCDAARARCRCAPSRTARRSSRRRGTRSGTPGSRGSSSSRRRTSRSTSSSPSAIARISAMRPRGLLRSRFVAS